MKKLIPELTARELDTAELSILILFRRHLDELPTDGPALNERESEAVRQAKRRMLDRWDDQIAFKTNRLRR